MRRNKNAFGELFDTDNLYRILFEDNKSIMMLINPNTGEIVDANKTAVAFYGYAREILITMKIQDINVSYSENVDKLMSTANESERNYFRYVHRLSNNEQREVEVQSYQVRIPTGVLLLTIIEDISEKNQQKIMFDSLFFNSPYAVAILDQSQRIININRNFTNMFQYTIEDAEEKTIDQLVSTIEGKSQIDHNIEMIYQGEIIKQEGIRRRKDGTKVEVEILAYPVINHQSIVGVYIIYIDITHKKAYEEQLQLYHKILENNTEGVVITDEKGTIHWVNLAFTKITGYTLPEISGKRMNILKSGIQNQVFYIDMWKQLMSKGSWSGEMWNKTKSGNINSIWLTINSINNNLSQITHYVGIFKDLSEKKKIDRKMVELQQKDSLTGLYNRNYFLTMVDKQIETCFYGKERFAIIFIDLDEFKEINNSLGHALGDKLLIDLSKRLLFLMSEKSLLARFNGDKFVILCKNAQGSYLNSFTKLLLNYIKKPFVIDNTILYITANIGISLFPENGTDAETLVRYADIAMANTKETAEGEIGYYSAKMSEDTQYKFQLANHLVRAITNNELTIYYQPIFDIKRQNNIIGVEALLRWNNPTLGEVPPNRFIPIAERTGQIIAIGEWVLEQVCEQIKLWQETGYQTVPIAVNISVKQLEQIRFAKTVLEIIKRNCVKANNIELEITESVSSGNISTIVKNLKVLKQNGFRIAMDDFGTGFSSLGQLDVFELDKLKIDKIFIDDLVSTSKRRNLVKSIIAMAKSMDITVVAEGIETPEQLDYLRKLGCHLGQGYLFSRPIPPDKMEAMLRQR